MELLRAIKRNLPKSWLGLTIVSAIPALILAQMAMTELRKDQLNEEFNKIHHKIVPATFENQIYQSENSRISYLFNYNGQATIDTFDTQTQQQLSTCSYEFNATHILGFVVGSSLGNVKDPASLIECEYYSNQQNQDNSSKGVNARSDIPDENSEISSPTPAYILPAKPIPEKNL
jgi:hypothetical protein